MKNKYFFLIIIFLCTLSCKEKPKKNTVRPVETMVVGETTQLEKIFSGIVEAEQYSYLGFRVNGMLQSLNVQEGQNVKAGQVIAELDPRDYNLKVSAAKAAYEQSKAQMERYKRLFSKGAVSKQDYEISKAGYENDYAVYNQAVNNRNDTRLLAPFSGNIEKKYAENHQEVSAGQRIVKLSNPHKIQYRIILPETVLKLDPEKLECHIELDIERGKWYHAKIKEMVSSSVQGSGIPVILVIDDTSFNASKTKVLPGFTCRVSIATSSEQSSQTLVIPLTSVYSDPKTGKTSVWKVNISTSTVSLEPVQIGNPSGESDIQIVSGLEKGDVIVTAGINLLSDGEKVKLLVP